MPGNLRFEFIWRLTAWLWVALVVWLSLTPAPLPQAQLVELDAGHLVAYAWLMFWFAQVHLRRRARIGIAIALVLMGVALELVQGQTSYRTLSYADMRDNSMGVVLGWWLALTRASRVLPAVDAWLARHAKSR